VRVVGAFLALTVAWGGCFAIALEVEAANVKAWERATGDQLKWARDERIAADPSGANPHEAPGLNFAASNAYERASGRRIAAGLKFDGLLLDAASPSTVTHGDGENRRWVVEGRHDSYGPAAEVWLRDPGAYTLRARRDDESEWTEVAVAARVVRKELRALSEGDRAAYFGALKEVYANDDAAGLARYGPSFKSANWLVREHLDGAARRDCDHWHDDVGIVNHHVGITWQLEKSLRAVDPTTAAHYWDYTIEGADPDPDAWKASPIFGDDWFGPAASNAPDRVVDRGLWARTPVLANARLYSNFTNPYGLLRSPWNTNRTPYLMRSSNVLGSPRGGFVMPTCGDFSPLLNGDAPSLAKTAAALNGGLHGPVHIMVGGHWGQEAYWSDYMANAAPFSSSQILLFSKFAWRQGYVRCPDACAADAPQDECRCACPASDPPRTPLTVLDEMHFRDADMPFSDAFGDTAVRKGDGGDGYFGANNITAEQILDLVCAVGFPGEMFTSAAPQDPLFWPLHGLSERFVQYARALKKAGLLDFDETWDYAHAPNIASDTGYVCDWGGAGDAAMPECYEATCPGHNEDDLLPFEDLFPGQRGLVTNAEFYARTHPIDGDTDYVYDTLDYWPACDGGSLFDAPRPEAALTPP